MKHLKSKKNALKAVALMLITLILSTNFLSAFADIELKLEQAEKMANEEFDALSPSGVLPSEYIAERNSIKVDEIKEGEENEFIISCTVNTIDVYAAVSPHYSEFLSAEAKKANGMQKSELNFRNEFEGAILSYLEETPDKEVFLDIYVYKTKDGYKVYTSEEAVNTVYGGALDLAKEVRGFKEYNDGTSLKEIESTNIPKGLANCFELRFDSEKPDTSTAFGKWWNGLKDDFKRNFIVSDRWKTVFTGLWVTIKLTVFALLIGIALGFVVAFVRCTYIKQQNRGIILKFFNAICQIYLTVIRGTPVVVQIMIIYFVIFMPIGVDKFIAAVVCFGLNSGAYVAEIVRGGIMSIDQGQTETGRSLGFNYIQTMRYIVFPQAFKACLPALANEFVVLLKETSVAFYIGVGDLMYSGNAIRAATYSAFMPLVAVALIYLIMVIGLSKLVSLLERRLRSSER